MNVDLPLKIFEVVPARPTTAGWAGRILRPAIQALRLCKPPPPLEFAALARMRAGQAPLHAPGDGRVQISSRAIHFWSARGLTETYVHELAHRFCFPVGEYGHGPIFFATLAVFSERIDLLSVSPNSPQSHSLALSLCLYDMQDRPSQLAHWTRAQWNSEVLSFGLECAAKLAAADVFAEDIPSDVSTRWKAHVQQIIADENVQAMELERLRAEIQQARSSSRVLAVLEAHPLVFGSLIAATMVLPVSFWKLATVFQSLRGCA